MSPKHQIFFLFFGLMLIFSELYSQQDSIVTVDFILNNILDEATIEKEDSQIYDLIEQLLENPININVTEIAGDKVSTSLNEKPKYLGDPFL